MQKVITIILLSLITSVFYTGCGTSHTEEESLDDTLDNLKLDPGSYDTTMTRVYEGCGLVPENETGEWYIGHEDGIYNVTVQTMDLSSDDGIIFVGQKVADWCTFRAIAFVHKTEDGFVGFVKIDINGLCGDCYDSAGIIGESKF